MNRNILRLLCLMQFVAAIAYSEIVVKKSTFISAQPGLFNIEISIARNTRTGDSLIAWQKTSGNEQKSQILARLINSNGKAITPVIKIADRAGLGDPSVAYNPISDEYAIVYDNSYSEGLSSHWGVFARRVDSRSRVKEEEVLLSSDTISKQMSNFAPKVVFHPKTGGFLVVWVRNFEPFSKNCGLVGTLLDQELARTGPVQMLQRSLELFQFPHATSIAFLPGGNKLLVAIKQFVQGEGQSAMSAYFLATVDPLLKSKLNAVRINRDPFPRDVSGSVTFAFLPDQSGILFFVDSNRIIRTRKIDIHGKLIGAERAAFNSFKANSPLTRPAAAFSTNAKGTQGLLMATEYGSGGATWAQLLDSKGNPVGTPVQVDRASDTGIFRSALLTELPINSSDTLFRFNWYGPLQQLSISGDITSSGIIQLNINVDVP